ncbi:DNA repair metallo-beta-lactamase-domain-containing protein [Collybia nuda]|uniref:DNA repair metallo-beta-lactamase-domain-containing protein n=1 Tax=Collybia nuda TaxID=64659 RepID=A0A9P6CD09_9AGAR|nr:DNA repair metallo-beta-lactamase-domain-containing protein [Collybia nuda]
MSSKKKGPPKSKVTLHNFFNVGSGSSTKEMGRVPASAKFALPKQAQPPQDIIIINSDSDDDPVEVIQTSQISSRTKRRRLSESSGEVEFVNPAPLRRKVNGSAPKQPRIAANMKSAEVQATLSGGSGSKSPSALDRSTQGNLSSSKSITPFKESTGSSVASFGAPSLLLRNSATIEADLASDRTKSFGAPFLLRTRDTQMQCSLSHNACSSMNCQAPSDNENFSPAHPGVSTAVDEGWETGDDEMALLRSSGNETEDEERQIKPAENAARRVSRADHKTLTQCPVCSRSVEGWLQPELQFHINNCLDSAKTSSKLSSPDTSTFRGLIPPTSLPPPRARSQLHLISCDGKTKPERDNAFDLIMSPYKENEAWNEASVTEDRNLSIKGHGGRRKAPFYKILQGMPIAVDAFRYGPIPGVTAYFLTHAHSDHYTNLSSTWKNGPIYCSEGTANLIIHMLSVDRQWVHPLPMDTPTVVPNTKGVRVTLIEANHCPGSCLFYFEGPQTVNAGDSAFQSYWIGSTKIFKYLHCGDFRASPQHVLHPEIRGKKIDHVYLDTTYLDPKYSFPPQPLVVSACAELARRLSIGQSHQSTSTVDSWFTTNDRASEESKPKPRTLKLLFIVGTYSIGKERIVKAIAQALHTKVYCDTRKAKILRCQSDTELNDLLTSNPLEASVHVVPLGLITSDKLKVYMERFKGQFDKAVGFRPTGWTYTQPIGSDSPPSIPSILSHSQHRDFTHANLRPARNSTTALQLYPIPYSEHSSFYELTCFAMSFEWGKMIPTVNVGNETSRGKMSKWVTKWETERKRKIKVEVVPYRHPDYW